MKIYIQYEPDKALYPLDVNHIIQNLEPSEFCEVDKYNYELDMDNEHKVTLDFAPLEVNYQSFEREMLRAINWAFDDQYSLRAPEDNDQNQ